jgi:hypothetical protein
MRFNSLFRPLIFIVSGCAHSTIIPFQTEGAKVETTPTTDPNTIGIYRVTHPIASFEEIGLITFRSPGFDLNVIFAQLRKDAATKGAEAIVDLKLSGEEHIETLMTQVCTPNTTCDGNGACVTDQACSMQPSDQSVSSFLAEGTLIRSKKVNP